MGNAKIVYEGGEGRIEEKKSKFIATVLPVKNEEEALAFLARMKKQYWDASHNCSAYVIGEGARLQRCSDDGEPQGTAGRPMLDVLLGEGVYDVAVVVTRYFGGTLLGTGGLVRAYSKAVQEGLRASTVLEICHGFRMRIRTDYSDYGKIQYLLGNEEIPITDQAFTDLVEIEILLSEEERDPIWNAVTETTGARAEILSETPVIFGLQKKERILL